jgi:putative hemolysin
MTSVEEFERLLGVRGLADPANYSTIAGLVVHALQRIAQTGDVIQLRNLKFEVADMDGRRIDKLIVALVAEEEDETVI